MAALRIVFAFRASNNWLPNWLGKAAETQSIRILAVFNPDTSRIAGNPGGKPPFQRVVCIMIQVRLTTVDWSPHRSDVERTVRAEYRVEGRWVEIRGEADYISLNLPVIDQETGQQLRFSDDPEAWARNLPAAYRNGDIAVEVIASVAGEAQFAGAADVGATPVGSR